MQRSEIEAFLARHEDLFAAHDAAGLAAQHAPESVFESPAAGRVEGRASIEQVYRYWFDAFPDMKFTWARPVIEGDRAAFFWSLSGTIKGPFFGVKVPGTRVEMNGAALYTFRDGQLVFAQHLFDFSALLMKAGVLKVKPT